MQLALKEALDAKEQAEVDAGNARVQQFETQAALTRAQQSVTNLSAVRDCWRAQWYSTTIAMWHRNSCQAYHDGKC